MDFRSEGMRRFILRSVNLSTLLLRGLKAERCDFLGKNRSGAGAVQNIDSILGGGGGHPDP